MEHHHTLCFLLVCALIARWIGRGGRTEWTPRSVHIIECDTLLWGWSAEEFCPSKPREHLVNWKKKIGDTFTTVLFNVQWKNVESVSIGLQK